MSNKEAAFYRYLGAAILLGNLAVTALVFLLGVTVDKWVFGVIGAGVLAGLALLRPELVSRAVKYGASKLPGRSNGDPSV